MPGAKRGRREKFSPAQRYQRSARVNEILREILADALERFEDYDERLGLLTITAVSADSDLRQAVVLFSSMSEEAETALTEFRIRLQAAISKEVRLKRTPLLRFAVDPAVVAGQRIEDIIRELPPDTSAEPE